MPAEDLHDLRRVRGTVRDNNDEERDPARFIPTEEDREFLKRWNPENSPDSVIFVTPSGYTLNKAELEYLRSKWLK